MMHAITAFLRMAAAACAALLLIYSAASWSTTATGSERQSPGAGGIEAAEELRHFASPGLRTRYYALLGQLRCPKCQNQNLADSDAPIATDLRNQLFRLLHDNQSDDQIREYMVARYGNFVLYSPPPGGYTAILWLLPLLLLLAAALQVWRVTRRAGPAPGKPEPADRDD